MNFDKGYIYHIYNQGNNRQKIFFNRDNYLFFLKKIDIYIKPYADIIAWCLMPNHFHLMAVVNKVELDVTHRVTTSHLVSDKPRTINQSIAIMLRSYTRAINKQKGISGALFREDTKAECINCPNGITPSFYNTKTGTVMHIDNPEEEYAQICFNYIHKNPVKANFVKNANDWEFSSAIDYSGLRDGKLIDREVAREYVVF